jgi:hypothetical protein
MTKARRSERQRQKSGRDQREYERVVAELTSAAAMCNPRHCAGLSQIRELYRWAKSSPGGGNVNEKAR